MKASKKAMVLSVVLCLLPTLAGIVLWDALPERVATHFDMNGVPDGWSTKGFAVFFLPAMLAAFDALCLYGTSRDPKAHRQSRVLQTVFLFFIPALSAYVMALVYCSALGAAVRVEFWMSLLFGVTFLVVGNYLPKCRRNYTMGIKLPWTLKSDENWNYTHRIGGFCWVICGVLALLSGLLGWSWMVFPLIALALVIPTAASYCYYRKNEKE